MFALKTKVINGTKVPIELKQGSANIYTTLSTLKSGETYVIHFNSAPTSIDYWCVPQPVAEAHPLQPVAGAHPQQPVAGAHPLQPVAGAHPLQPVAGAHPRVIITSDDCAENKEVEIVEDPVDSRNYSWNGTKRSNEPAWKRLIGPLKPKVTFRFGSNLVMQLLTQCFAELYHLPSSHGPLLFLRSRTSAALCVRLTKFEIN
jgi:hypothetical protein